MKNGLASDISFEAVNPRDLSDDSMCAVHEVIQDFWATKYGGLGELANCSRCSRLLAKEDIFSQNGEVLSDTVADIMRITGKNNLECPYCGDSVSMIYGQNHLDELTQKMRDSRANAYMVLVRNKAQKLVGHASYYVGSIEDFYSYELHYHYSHLNVEIIRERIGLILENVPEKLIILSAIGFLPQYRNAIHLFQLMKKVVTDVPDNVEMHGYAGIMELDRTNPMHRIFRMQGGAEINTCFGQQELVAQRIAPSYESRIVVCDSIYTRFRTFFKLARGPKSFIQPEKTYMKSRR